MATFRELPISTGVGPVHLNRFRTRIKPKAGKQLPSGRDLIGLMTQFMNPDTAKVRIDRTHRWKGEATLEFTGVARVRPFIWAAPFALPLPDWMPESVGVPRIIRDWMIPDVHTDSVGLAAGVGEHQFTVQTLRRLYQTREDIAIRFAIQELTLMALVPLLPIKEVVRPAVKPLSDKLAEHALNINRHHFLAGRRSFRMGTAKQMGEKDGDYWIFETAAVERYSLPEYQEATDKIMGGASATVAPVWRRMGRNVAKQFGTIIGEVEGHTSIAGSVGSARGSTFYKYISRYHQALLP